MDPAQTTQWLDVAVMLLGILCPVLGAFGITVTSKYKRVINTAANVMNDMGTPNSVIAQALAEKKDRAILKLLSTLEEKKSGK